MAKIIPPNQWGSYTFPSLDVKSKVFPPSGKAERALTTLVAYADDGDSREVPECENEISDFISEAENAHEAIIEKLDLADRHYDDIVDTMRHVLGFIPHLTLIEDDDEYEVRNWAAKSLTDYEYSHFTNARGKKIHIIVINTEADRTLFMLRWR